MRWGGAVIDPSDPVLPEGVEALADHVTAPAELHRRLRQIGLVDRAEASRFVTAAEARPAAGVARRRSVALGRLCGRGQCADRRRAPSRRAQSAGGDRAGTRCGARRCRSQAAGVRRKAEAEAASANEAETEARNRWRELQRAADAARERHAGAERDLSHITNRRAALTEAKARLGASRDEAAAAQTEAQRALVRIAGRGRTGNQAERGALRDHDASREGRRSARRGAGADARSRDRQEAAGSDRRRAAGLDRHPRTDREADRGARRTAGRGHAPSATAWSMRRGCSRRSASRCSTKCRMPRPRSARRAMRWPQGESAATAANSAVRAALDALSDARERLGRSEERCEGAKRRLSDIEHEIRDMLEVEPRASRRSPRLPKARSCRTSPRSRPSLKSCGANASGSARSICAPKRN